MNTPGKTGVEARPVSIEGADHRPILREVVVCSDHHASVETVHLTPDQALYVQSRLSAVAMAFLHGQAETVHGLGLTSLPTDHETHMSRCGAKVWPISRADAGRVPVLEEIVLESDGPEGHGVVRLTPAQARQIHDSLTRIAMAFLHENQWGGEDALAQ